MINKLCGEAMDTGTQNLTIRPVCRMLAIFASKTVSAGLPLAVGGVTFLVRANSVDDVRLEAFLFPPPYYFRHGSACG